MQKICAEPSIPPARKEASFEYGSINVGVRTAILQDGSQDWSRRRLFPLSGRVLGFVITLCQSGKSGLVV